VVRFESVKCLLALGARYKLHLYQMDVPAAFLHGELSEEVYMRQPQGFVKNGQENLVWHLKCNIHGLKQSPRCWNTAPDKQLKELGFKQTASDPCLYVCADSEGELLVVTIYVDNIIVGGSLLKSNET